MSATTVTALIVLSLGALVFVTVLVLRRYVPALQGIDPTPWASTLSYVATAYGVVIGFSIVFLFGTYASARQAVGDEATSIGTAFEEVRLFPDDTEAVQHALICYSRAVPEYDFPALRDGGSAAEVDVAYRNVIVALGEAGTAPDGAFHAAAATNVFAQIGSISTARETRLVAAQNQIPSVLWILLIGGGLFVMTLMFVVTVHAGPLTQAVLMSMATLFTCVMISIVIALSTPFAAGSGRVTPRLIEDTTALMKHEAPAAAALPCDLGD